MESEIKKRVDFHYSSSCTSDLDMVSPLLIFQNLLRRNNPDVSLLTIEQPSNIFQSQTASLGVLEPDAEDHGDQDSKEHKVVLPLNGIKRDGIDEGVEEGEGERGHLDEGETFGSQLVGPDLDGVGDDERGEGDVVAEKVAVKWPWLEDALAYAECDVRMDLHEEERYDSKPGGCVAGRSEAAGQSRNDNVRNKHDNGLKKLVAGPKRR
jgi:hypothetical protein